MRWKSFIRPAMSAVSTSGQALVCIGTVAQQHTGTRKLKCSGNAPHCVRCRRENIDCVYSPQKQMGRPRKRRRDGEADEPTEELVESRTEYTNILDDFPGMPNLADFGLISPPLLQDTHSSIDSAGFGAVTPVQLDLGHTNPFEIQLNQDLGYNSFVSYDALVC
jgi:hypothetical protein